MDIKEFVREVYHNILAQYRDEQENPNHAEFRRAVDALGELINQDEVDYLALFNALGFDNIRAIYGLAELNDSIELIRARIWNPILMKTHSVANIEYGIRARQSDEDWIARDNEIIYRLLSTLNMPNIFEILAIGLESSQPDSGNRALDNSVLPNSLHPGNQRYMLCQELFPNFSRDLTALYDVLADRAALRNASFNAIAHFSGESAYRLTGSLLKLFQTNIVLDDNALATIFNLMPLATDKIIPQILRLKKGEVPVENILEILGKLDPQKCLQESYLEDVASSIVSLYQQGIDHQLYFEALENNPGMIRMLIFRLDLFGLLTQENIKHCFENAQQNFVSVQDAAWALIGLAKRYPKLNEMPKEELTARLRFANQLRHLFHSNASRMPEEMKKEIRYFREDGPKTRAGMISSDYSGQTNLALILKCYFKENLQNPRLYSSASMDQYCADMHNDRLHRNTLLNLLNTTTALAQIIDRRRTVDLGGEYLPPLGSLGILTPEIFAELIEIDTIGYCREAGSRFIPESERLGVMRQISNDLVDEVFLKPVREALQEIGINMDQWTNYETDIRKVMCEQIHANGFFDRNALIELVQTKACEIGKDLSSEPVVQALKNLEVRLLEKTGETVLEVAAGQSSRDGFFRPAGEGSSSASQPELRRPPQSGGSSSPGGH